MLAIIASAAGHTQIVGGVRATTTQRHHMIKHDALGVRVASRKTQHLTAQIASAIVTLDDCHAVNLFDARGILDALHTGAGDLLCLLGIGMDTNQRLLALAFHAGGTNILVAASPCGKARLDTLAPAELCIYGLD